MNVRLGSDIVYIPKFEETLAKSREYFVKNVFWPQEIKDAKIQRLASIFAAKEATIKALDLEAGQWHDIRIAYKDSGKPYLVKFPQEEKLKKPFDKAQGKQWKHELSISHDGDYVIANVIFYQ